MRLDTNISIDFTSLNTMLDPCNNIPRDGNTRLAMNNNTVYALTGKYFYDDRIQTYHGFKIIQDEYLNVGEVIILVNYERMKFQYESEATC